MVINSYNIVFIGSVLILPIIAVSDDYTSFFAGFQFGKIHLRDVLQLPAHDRADTSQLPEDVSSLFTEV